MRKRHTVEDKVMRVLVFWASARVREYISGGYSCQIKEILKRWGNILNIQQAKKADFLENNCQYLKLNNKQAFFLWKATIGDSRGVSGKIRHKLFSMIGRMKNRNKFDDIWDKKF